MADYVMRLYQNDEVLIECDVNVESEVRALAAAKAVFDACTESVQDFDLVRDGTVVRPRASGIKRLNIRPDELTLETQARVLEIEETLLKSRLRLSRSRQLLARTQLYKSAVTRRRQGS